MNDHINIVRIKAVNRALGKYADQSAFVGGATVSLYADTPSFEARPTDDVDVIVELLSYAKESELDEELRKIGFRNDIESGIRYRYRYDGLIVDVVPVQSEVSGFGNKWYPDGYRNAIIHRIDDRSAVKIFTAPYFIATKLEAFLGRGRGDGRTSRDFEDIVFVLEHRAVVWEELEETNGELRLYLRVQFQSVLQNKYADEWIGAHVDRNNSPPATDFIISNLRRFVTTDD